MIDLILKLLKYADVSIVTKQDLHLQLLSHSDYPSLKAITDSLDYFGVENIAANVPKDALGQLPVSFLALIDYNGKNSLVLVTQKGEVIKTVDDSGKKKSFKIEDFQKLWTGTIIAIEVSEKATSKPKLEISKEFSLAGIAILIIYGLLIIKGFNYLPYVYTTFSLLGLAMSYFIVKAAAGEGNAIVSKVCGAITNEAKGCGAVINSKKGTILKNVSLGDMSMIYFLSATMSAAILGIHINIFLVISILSLPVIIYTIYTQAFILKSWCFLCLGVASILLIKFGILTASFKTWDFSLEYLFSMLFITTMVTLGWFVIKPLLENKKDLQSIRKDFLSFKRNEIVFDTILKENEVENLQVLPLDSQVFFGNRNGALQLTAYTNPLCGYCTEAFENYDTLLSQFPNDIGIQFVFNTPTTSDNPSTLISKRVIELYQGNSQKAFEALRDWFAIKDIDVWKSTYGASSSMLLTYDAILNKHRDVVTTNGINYTPETLMGTSKLSREHYQYKDIPLFLNHFKEKKEEITTTLIA